MRRRLARAPTSGQTVGGIVDSRRDVSAQEDQGTGNAEGDNHQQQGIFGGRGAFFFLYKPTNRIQHGVTFLFCMVNGSLFETSRKFCARLSFATIKPIKNSLTSFPGLSRAQTGVRIGQSSAKRRPD